MVAFTVSPIGVLTSKWERAEGTPIQPFSARDSLGSVDVLEPYADGLLDLVGFSRIWLIYEFDRATAPELHVRTYRDPARLHGVFSTRIPARPNAIGMSCVRLLSVEGSRLELSEVDILNGTPIIDIKPYVPQYDSYPNERAGWLDDPEV
jgi:tRNA-Thr(GGU) m(6)t(6)A37 methyltransferase TsaA